MVLNSVPCLVILAAFTRIDNGIPDITRRRTWYRNPIPSVAQYDARNML